MNAVKAETHGIGKRKTKSVILGDRCQMAEAIARVSVARQVCNDGAPCGGFLAKVLLDNVITVKTILLTEFDINVR